MKSSFCQASCFELGMGNGFFESLEEVLRPTYSSDLSKPWYDGAALVVWGIYQWMLQKWYVRCRTLSSGFDPELQGLPAQTEVLPEVVVDFKPELDPWASETSCAGFGSTKVENLMSISLVVDYEINIHLGKIFILIGTWPCWMFVRFASVTMPWLAPTASF